MLLAAITITIAADTLLNHSARLYKVKFGAMHLLKKQYRGFTWPSSPAGKIEITITIAADKLLNHSARLYKVKFGAMHLLAKQYRGFTWPSSPAGKIEIT